MTATARSGREHVFPASFAQERLWFLTQLEPEVPLYNVNMVQRLPGPVDPDRLEQALALVVGRHEALRTALRVEEGALVQAVAHELPVALERSDLADVPEERREEEFDALAAAEAAAPFALDRPPLCRARLVRVSQRDWRLLFVVHHALFDARSAHNFFGVELREAYRALEQGRPPSLPELPIQYADYAVWQRDRFESGAFAEQLRYWQRRLDGAPAELSLPGDRGRRSPRTYAGAEHELHLPAELVRAAAELARREGATTFMVLLAAFEAVVARYCGEDDVVVGSPVAGRDLPELEPLIGMFVNTLVLRTDLSGDPGFRELLRRVRETVLEALDHADVPFEKLVEALEPDRDPSRAPLHQLGFNLLPIEELGQYGNGTSKRDLTLNVVLSEDGASVTIEYSTELYEAETVRSFARAYATLLVGAVGDPDRRISALPLLDPEEARRLRRSWHGPTVDLPERLLHELVAEQVERTPDAVALVAEDERLTFRQLDARANRLARRLSGAGVTAGTPVGVCAERSAELVVALLAALRAGGAFLPLDPELPAARLAFMVADAGAPVVVAGPGAPDLPAEVVRAEDGAELVGPPAPAVSLDDPAYLIYTSGSTGRPKGVTNTHRGVVNLLDWMTRTHRPSADDVVLHKTPLGFDVSVWEIFWPLATGARLVLARAGGHREPAYLRDLIVERRVTTAHFVPSLLAAFLATEGVEECRSLRRVMCGGEALSPQLAARFFERLDAELYDVYGPAETAIDVCAWRCVPGEERVPIGRPIQNTSLYVVDDALEPLPAGAAGELAITGPGVARGYLGRPGLTAERFVPDPFGPPGGRLYRTGDRGRIRPDGALEYLGRRDGQVKLRGLRIELGEIEAVLREQPSVEAAAAALRGERLTAYVVGEAEPEELRAALRGTLPRAMVPASFVRLDALPLSPNGKVDRAALPDPEGDAGSAFAPPRTPLERELCELWRELLGVERVGIADDFFSLGGHSLLLADLVARIGERYAVDLPLRRCFEITTVAEYALLVLESQLAEEPEGVEDVLAGLEVPA